MNSGVTENFIQNDLTLVYRTSNSRFWKVLKILYQMDSVLMVLLN